MVKASTVLPTSHPRALKQMTLLFTALKVSTAMYERLGDLNAYALVREHFALLGTTVQQHSGAIVKTIGDAVMAVFSHPESRRIDQLLQAGEIFQALFTGHLAWRRRAWLEVLGIGIFAIPYSALATYCSWSFVVVSYLQNSLSTFRDEYKIWRKRGYLK